MNTTRDNGKRFGYGLIGAGRFGQFCVQAYQSLAQLEPIAVADLDHHAAQAAADSLGLIACRDIDQLLARNDIQLVHIATPPFTHPPLVMRALEAGKHVLCEKPLATTLQDAQAMIDLAAKQKRLLAVNLIMRYNPLCEAVKKIIDAQYLGQPLHGFFENDAKDEPLPPDHWFWNRRKSGGIFIEHGVHFFDLFNWWLGPAHVEAAQQSIRPGTDLVEQVNATVRYNNTVLVNFFHSFTQADRMDRQEMRLLFERGTLRLLEWVPTSIQLDALLTGGDLEKLTDLLPDAQVETLATYTGDDRRVTSRHKPCEVDGRYRITASTGMDKPDLYRQVLCSLLTDQITATRDPNHTRRITETNGYTSLATAVAATCLARQANE